MCSWIIISKFFTNREESLKEKAWIRVMFMFVDKTPTYNKHVRVNENQEQ